MRKEVLDPEVRQNHATDQLLYRTHCALVRLDEEISNLEIEINGLRFATENPDEELIKQKQEQLKPLNRTFPTLLQVAERSYLAHRVDEHGITKLMAIRAEIAELDESIEATEGSYASAAYLGYRERLYSSGKPVVNLSYINSFFNVR